MCLHNDLRCYKRKSLCITHNDLRYYHYHYYHLHHYHYAHACFSFSRLSFVLDERRLLQFLFTIIRVGVNDVDATETPVEMQFQTKSAVFALRKYFFNSYGHILSDNYCLIRVNCAHKHDSTC